jgi:hypothetical protein
MIRIVASAAFAVALIASSALAQKGETVSIKGKIASVDGSTLVIDQAKGAGQAKVAVNEKAAILTIGPGTIKDITPKAFIGVGAIPQADGSQKAIRVMIFAETQRGTNEGHYPWKGAPAGTPAGSTMTNATVGTTVAGVDGQVVTVNYKGGTQKIIVGPDAQILLRTAGSTADLKPGVNVSIPAAKAADGSLSTMRVDVGRGNFVP